MTESLALLQAGGLGLLDPASVIVLAIMVLFAIFIWWGNRKQTIARYQDPADAGDSGDAQAG